MKREFRLTLVAFALLALCSCGKEEAPATHDGVRYPILYGINETRAMATVEGIKSDGFQVYTYTERDGNGAGYDHKANYMVQDGVGFWAYSEENIKYWSANTNYWFKAVYPAVPTSATLGVDNTTSAQAINITGLDITKQEDILIAKAERAVAVGSSTPTQGSKVNLEFEHLLSCVVVSIKADAEGVYVDNVVMDGLAQEANFANGIWTANQTATLSKVYSGDALVAGAKDFTNITGDGFLVIPQVINGTQKMTIKTHTTIYADGSEIKQLKDYVATLPNATWESGKKYTYTLTIKQENIVFNEPDVEVWDEENATGSVVIK